MRLILVSAGIAFLLVGCTTTDHKQIATMEKILDQMQESNRINRELIGEIRFMRGMAASPVKSEGGTGEVSRLTLKNSRPYSFGKPQATSDENVTPKKKSD